MYGFKYWKKMIFLFKCTSHLIKKSMNSSNKERLLLFATVPFLLTFTTSGLLFC